MSQPGYDQCGCCGNLYKSDGSESAMYDEDHDPTKDVHTEHCCSKHGCKYQDDDCTVTVGNQSQSFPCEWCERDREEVANWLPQATNAELLAEVTRRNLLTQVGWTWPQVVGSYPLLYGMYLSPKYVPADGVPAYRLNKSLDTGSTNE